MTHYNKNHYNKGVDLQNSWKFSEWVERNPYQGDTSGFTEWLWGLPVYPYASIFDMMKGEEFEALVEDIRQHGQSDPIVIGYLDEGLSREPVILDGRNRLRACEVLGVEPTFRTEDMLEPHEFADWIVSKNIRRRHLEKGQLAFLAAEGLAVEAEFAKARRKATQNNDAGRAEVVNLPPQAKTGKARDIVAKRFGVSGKSVSDAATVMKHDPDLAEAGKRGEVAPSTAARQIRQKIREEQAENNPPAPELPPHEQEKLDSHLKMATEKAHEVIDSLSGIDYSKSTPGAKAKAIRELELTRSKITRMLSDMRNS